jgi:hypothetical protein
MRSAFAVIAAITFSLSAQSVPPNASPSATTKDTGTIGKLDGHKEADKAKRDASNCPAVASSAECPNCCAIEQPVSKNKEEQAKSDSLDTLTRRYMWATIFGVAGAFIGLGLIFWQTKIAARSAKTASLNTQAVIDSERPWIVIDVERQPVPPKWCNFAAANRGRTPAQIISGSATHVFVVDPDDLKVPPVYESPFVLPNKTLIVQTDSFPIYPQPGIRPQVMADNRPAEEKILSDNKILIFYGRVVYDDVFGTKRPGYVPHETRWCFAYFPDGHRFVRTGPEEYNRNS